MQTLGIGAGSNEAWAVALRNGVAPWVAAHPTSTNVDGRGSVFRAIAAWLDRLAFHVTFLGPEPGIIIATRAGVGPLRIGITGHYDVETIGLGWTHPPREVTRAHDRIFGRGMADNLGPLWLRLAALEAHVGPAPSLLFVLQGEEEIGSPAAHSAFPALELPHVNLWLEETGYFELDGSQRLLACNLDETTEPLVATVERVATAHRRLTRRHSRFLNKAFGADRCPFLTHVIAQAPYLAIGPNDPVSAIHQPNESLPEQHLDLSARQFQALLSAAAESS